MSWFPYPGRALVSPGFATNNAYARNASRAVGTWQFGQFARPLLIGFRRGAVVDKSFVGDETLLDMSSATPSDISMPVGSGEFFVRSWLPSFTPPHWDATDQARVEDPFDSSGVFVNGMSYGVSSDPVDDLVGWVLVPVALWDSNTFRREPGGGLAGTDAFSERGQQLYPKLKRSGGAGALAGVPMVGWNPPASLSAIQCLVQFRVVGPGAVGAFFERGADANGAYTGVEPDWDYFWEVRYANGPGFSNAGGLFDGTDLTLTLNGYDRVYAWWLFEGTDLAKLRHRQRDDDYRPARIVSNAPTSRQASNRRGPNNNYA